MMNFRRSKKLFLSFLLVFVLSVVSVNVSVFAQGGAISVGENRTGQLTLNSPSSTYLLNISTPRVVTLQVLSLSNTYLPALTVLDDQGVMVLANLNLSNSTAIQSTANLTATGNYQIIVQGNNNSVGSYVLSVQPAAQLAPATPLSIGQRVSASLDNLNPLQTYSFTSASTGDLYLAVEASAQTNVPSLLGPIITLRDAETNAVLATSSAAFTATRYRIPQGIRLFALEVAFSASSVSEPYQVCLWEIDASPCAGFNAQVGAQPTAAPTSTPVPVVASPVPVIPANGACSVTPTSANAVNVRRGPGTNYAQFAQILRGQIIPVIGRSIDNTWVQINTNGTIGWVSLSVVTIGGNCGNIPVVAAPTMTPTPVVGTVIPAVTITATLPLSTATSAVTATPTVTPTTMLTLNRALFPNFGETALTGGFVPDPHSHNVISGLSVDGTYLGTSCRGFYSQAPDYRVTYTPGGLALLRFYLTNTTGDTTLIVQDPLNNFFCNDDSFGTLNPTIDIANPQFGTYDIWVGSFINSSTLSAATLNVTELSSNHP